MNQNLAEIICILDRSGSMEEIKNDAIGGFNSFLEDQKKVPGEARMTIVLFDDKYEILCDGLDIQQVFPMDDKTYVPRGWTALLDAIGKTINTVGERLDKTLENDRPSKIIVAILTDGYENASTKFTREKIFDMIKHQTDNYSWEFMYLGANQDAIAVGMSMGIAAQNSYQYVGNSAGTRSVYTVMSANVTQSRTA